MLVCFIYIHIYIWQCLISCCAQDAPHPGRDPSTLREHDGRAGPAWHRNGPILDRAGPGPSTIKMSLCTLRCQGGPCKTKLGAMPRPNWSVHVPTGSCPGHLEKPKKTCSQQSLTIYKGPGPNRKIRGGAISVENIDKFIVKTDTWRIRASSLRNEMQKCTLICNKTLCFSRPHSRRPHMYIKL